MFSVLGFMAHELKTSVGEVVTSGESGLNYLNLMNISLTYGAKQVISCNWNALRCVHRIFAKEILAHCVTRRELTRLSKHITDIWG